jgi:hypothetical protein
VFTNRQSLFSFVSSLLVSLCSIENTFYRENLLLSHPHQPAVHTNRLYIQSFFRVNQCNALSSSSFTASAFNKPSSLSNKTLTPTKLLYCIHSKVNKPPPSDTDAELPPLLLRCIPKLNPASHAPLSFSSPALPSFNPCLLSMKPFSSL